MRYDDFRRSDDIEDRRDDGGGGMGGGFGIPMGGGGGLGIGTIIVLGLLGYAFGIDPRILIGGAEILTGGGSQAPSYQQDRPSGQRKAGAPTDEMGSMISGVLGEIDDRWSEIFQASGQNYTGPKIVLFRNATNGGRCGMAQSAMGPFYCPPDRTIFLDTAFFYWSGGKPNPEFAYANKSVNDLIKQAEKATDPAVAKPLWEQAQDQIAKDMPTVPIVNSTPPAAAKADVKGFVGSGNLTELLNSVWLDR